MAHKQEFHGSCHCGKIRYKVALALPPPPEQPTATRCNCTICLKTGFTGVRVDPDNDFTLLSPDSFDELPDYQFNLPTVHRCFCRNCGVQVCGKGDIEVHGEPVHFFIVNLHSLDQPQDGLDVSRFKMEYWDGRTNNWDAGKKGSPYPGGCA